MFTQYLTKHKSTLKYLSQLAAVFSTGLAIIAFDQVGDAALRRDFSELQKSVDATNAATNARIDETNATIVTTNARIDKTSERLDKTNELLDETSERLDKTSERLGKTSELLDETNELLDELTRSVNTLVATVTAMLGGSSGRQSSPPIAPGDADGQAKDTGSRIRPVDPEAGSLARSGTSNCASAAAGAAGAKSWVAPVNLFRRAEPRECLATRSG